MLPGHDCLTRCHPFSAGFDDRSVHSRAVRWFGKVGLHNSSTLLLRCTSTSVCHHDNSTWRHNLPLHSAEAAPVVSHQCQQIAPSLCCLAQIHVQLHTRKKTPKAHAIFHTCQKLQFTRTATHHCACSNMTPDGRYAFLLKRNEGVKCPDELVKLDLHTAEHFWLVGRCMTEARATAVVRAWVTVLRDVLCKSSCSCAHAIKPRHISMQ